MQPQGTFHIPIPPFAKEVRISNGNFGINGNFVKDPVLPSGLATVSFGAQGYYNRAFPSFQKPANLPTVVVNAELYTLHTLNQPFMLTFADRAYKTLP